MMDRPDDVAALHALRRSVRRVRFGLEWIGEQPRRIVDLQEALGVVGDRMAALRHLELLAEEGAQVLRYRRRLRQELRAGVREARRQWKRCRESLEDTSRWTSS